MNPPDPSSASRIGSLCLAGAALIWIAFGLELAEALPAAVADVWAPYRWLWFVLGFALPVQGGRLLLGEEPPVPGWRPEQGGPRFRQVRVYSREHCPLCDEALEILHQHAQWLGPIEVVDIDTNPDWQEKYGHWVPVVECDGQWRFRGRISIPLLRRLIACTRPLDNSSRNRHLG